MNFALTEEQEFLQEAARGTLGRAKTLEAARDALEGSPSPDLWGSACEAGWAGLLIAEDHEGAGLEPLDAMLWFRKAQLSRRLLGGTAGAADRLAGELFEQAKAVMA